MPLHRHVQESRDTLGVERLANGPRQSCDRIRRLSIGAGSKWTRPLGRCEIGSGEFSRTLTLPCAVDGSKASAHLKDGMLELTLPKVEKSRRHTIKID